MVKLFQYLHEHAGMAKKVFFGVLVIAVILDFFVRRHAVHFVGDRLYGFWSIFGVGGCLAMIFLCKWLSGFWLKRDEGYYDK